MSKTKNPPLAPGSVVDHKDALWLVTEICDAVGGGKVAQLNCLQRDAAAAVAVDGLETVECTAETIEDLTKRRESDMAPVRQRKRRRMLSKHIHRCNVSAKVALDRGDKAEAERLTDRAAVIQGNLDAMDAGGAS